MSLFKIFAYVSLLLSKPNIDRPQQAVSAAIIQNSAIANFSPKTEWPKTKAAHCLNVLFHANFESKLFFRFPTQHLQEC